MNRERIRRGSGIVLCVCFLGLAGSGALLAQPANDDCADALPIFDGGTSFSTVNATTDGPTHAGCELDPQTHNDIWFQHMATCTGNLTVSTCGTADYDTDLVLYDGCDCGSLPSSFQACNDDTPGCANFTSELIEPVLQGSCYLVRLGGFDSSSEGSGTVNISCAAVGDAACCLPDDTCVVTNAADCQMQGGSFHSTAGSCTPGVCSFSNDADVIYSDCNSVFSWGEVGGIRGYSLQSQTCNIGDVDLQWNSNGPLLAMNAYRLIDGRLIQIGMSWVKNATTAIALQGCAPPCMGGGGPVLGPGCQDVYSAGFNGGQDILGPRSAVNAFTGVYPGPPGGAGDAIFKRLQIAESDLSPTNGLYFVEGHYVAPDDAGADNAMNNASYKRVTVDGAFDLTPQGSMFETRPAIFAWRDHGLGVDAVDPSVQIATVDVPNEGRFHVAAKITDLGAGGWRHDYAVRNHNSDRSAGSFSVQLPATTNATNLGFHDVDYHSGEIYDPASWPSSVSAGLVTWSSPRTFAQDANTNALRFATMYNFWFETDAPPVTVDATLGLFKPDPKGPDSVDTSFHWPVLLRNDAITSLGPTTPPLVDIFTGPSTGPGCAAPLDPNTSLDPFGADCAAEDFGQQPLDDDDTHGFLFFSGDRDPDFGILSDASRPLVFYLVDDVPTSTKVLSLSKDSPNDTVILSYD